jgi:hypothetical protein
MVSGIRGQQQGRKTVITLESRRFKYARPSKNIERPGQGGDGHLLQTMPNKGRGNQGLKPSGDKNEGWRQEQTFLPRKLWIAGITHW